MTTHHFLGIRTKEVGRNDVFHLMDVCIDLISVKSFMGAQQTVILEGGGFRVTHKDKNCLSDIEYKRCKRSLEGK